MKSMTQNNNNKEREREKKGCHNGKWTVALTTHFPSRNDYSNIELRSALSLFAVELSGAVSAAVPEFFLLCDCHRSELNSCLNDTFFWKWEIEQGLEVASPWQRWICCRSSPPSSSPSSLFHQPTVRMTI